jgi:anti-sigma B factor antagonist
MAIDFKDERENFRRVTISERLDIQGTDAIATRFAAIVASANRSVVVDLTGVSFLSSIGLRAIISNAKALQKRGGKMVLFVGANEMVAKTLLETGIDALIPVCVDSDAADAAARS